MLFAAQARFQAGLFLLGIFTCCAPAPVLGDLDALLRQVPPTANGLLLVDATALRQDSQLWQGAAWSSGNGKLGLPPSAELVVMAAEFDLQHMAPLEQMAALQLSSDINLPRAARELKGYTDRIGQTPVVWLEQGCLLVLEPRQATLVSPLNRQSAARWLRRAASTESSQMSSFLTEASQPFAAGTSQLVLALDLADMLDPAAVDAAVAANPLFETVNREAASSALKSLRGLSLQANLQTSQCRISFAFGETPDALRPVAKQLIRRWLTSVGAGIEGLENWELSGEGLNVDLLGPLDAGLVRRLLSLHSLASSNRDAVAAEPEPTTPPSDPAADAAAAEEQRAQRERERTVRRSQSYFQQIDEKLRDLQLTGDNLSFDQATLWVNNYSRLIAALPTNGVDPELVAYGQSVSRGLENMLAELNRAQSRALQELTQRPETGRTRVTAVPTDRINYGGHVRYRYAPVISQDLYLGNNENAYRDQVNQGNDKARQILAEMMQQHEAMRKKMSDRYETAF